MRDKFIETLTDLAEVDDSIMLLTGDLGFGVLTEFAQRFPKQFLNVGVAEQNMIGVATGLAMEGYTVFTYSIANFAFMRCLEQIRNDAAYHDANVNVVSVGGGFSYGALGISHHATEDLAIMRSLPGLAVVSPCDEWETAEATKAIANQPGASYLRLDKSSAGGTQRSGEKFQFGKIRTLRNGSDLTLVATGGIVGEVIDAANTLVDSGINCRVLSVHSLKPLDLDTLTKAATETGGIVTIEEHTIHGGLGGAVAEAILETSSIPSIFHRIGLRDQFSSVVGSQAYLRARYKMSATDIAVAVQSLLAKADMPKRQAA